jgi:hypothetical protein
MRAMREEKTRFAHLSPTRRLENAGLRKTVSLTSHISMVGIRHALFNLFRMVCGSPLDLRSDDARLSSRIHEGRAIIRFENCCGGLRLPLDQDSASTMQCLQAILSRGQTEAAIKSSGLTKQSFASTCCQPVGQLRAFPLGQDLVFVGMGMIGYF